MTCSKLVALSVLFPLFAVCALGSAKCAQAGECPDLRGTYSCPDGSSIRIDQSGGEIATVYVINGVKIVADGNPRDIGSNSDSQASETYSCKGGALVRTLAMGPVASREAWTVSEQGLEIASGLVVPGNEANAGKKSCARR